MFSDKRRCLSQGTISQADVDCGGQQCTCVALTFICRHLMDSSSTLKFVHCPSTIDEIVRSGTELYWSHINGNFNGKAKYLMFTELPDMPTIDGVLYPVVLNKVDIFAGLIGTASSSCESLTLTLSDGLLSAFAQHPSCLISIGNNPAYTIAVIQVNKSSYLCFDSHRRSSDGMSKAGGTAVLLEVESITSLVKYITDLAQSLFIHPSTAPFEIVSVLRRPTTSSSSTINTFDCNGMLQFNL